MRPTIDIDDRLLAEPGKASGLERKTDVVQDGLRLLVRLDRQKRFKEWRGKLRWEGEAGGMDNTDGRSFGLDVV